MLLDVAVTILYSVFYIVIETLRRIDVGPLWYIVRQAINVITTYATALTSSLKL